MNQLRSNIAEMAAYVPGFQPENVSAFIKLNTNENPYPPSPAVIQAIQQEAGDRLRQYPDAKGMAPRLEAARIYGFDPSWIIMANGSDEVLNNLIRCFAAEGEEVGYVHPSYSYYQTLVQIQGARVRTFQLSTNLKFEDSPENFRGKIFFLTNPHAPFGFSFSADFIENLAQTLSGILVIDEAYVDFAEENSLALVRRYENVVVTRTFSKSYSLAGMRIGLAIARPEIIQALDKVRDHYNLDRLAQAAATASLRDQDYFRACVEKIRATREWFSSQLRELGFSVIPSQSNFVFAVPQDRDGKRIHDRLYQQKILVRYFSDPLLKHGVRISIGTQAEMEKTVKALQDVG
ncbi:MAG: histidinol-phosphate transaminase [Deltaproteobacteria bacterium]|nr:histidinol-phosphate transaminase [Deltaproteobacteria bacterium]